MKKYLLALASSVFTLLFATSAWAGIIVNEPAANFIASFDGDNNISVTSSEDASWSESATKNAWLTENMNGTISDYIVSPNGQAGKIISNRPWKDFNSAPGQSYSVALYVNLADVATPNNTKVTLFHFGANGNNNVQLLKTASNAITLRTKTSGTSSDLLAITSDELTSDYHLIIFGTDASGSFMQVDSGSNGLIATSETSLHNITGGGIQIGAGYGSDGASPNLLVDEVRGYSRRLTNDEITTLVSLFPSFKPAATRSRELTVAAETWNVADKWTPTGTPSRTDEVNLSATTVDSELTIDQTVLLSSLALTGDKKITFKSDASGNKVSALVASVGTDADLKEGIAELGALTITESEGVNITLGNALPISLTGAPESITLDESKGEEGAAISAAGLAGYQGPITLKDANVNFGKFVLKDGQKFIAESGESTLDLWNSDFVKENKTADTDTDATVQVKSGATLNYLGRDLGNWGTYLGDNVRVYVAGTLNSKEITTDANVACFTSMLVLDDGVVNGLSDSNKTALYFYQSNEELGPNIRVLEGTSRWTGYLRRAVSLFIETKTDAILQFSGTLTGANGQPITKYGEGVLEVSVAQGSYTGTTTIKAGTVKVTSAGTMGTGTIVVENGAVFEHAGTASLANTISGVGTIKQSGSGELILKANKLADFTGSIEVSDGTITLPLAWAKKSHISGTPTLKVILAGTELLEDQSITQEGVTVYFYDEDNNPLVTDEEGNPKAGDYKAPIKTWTIAAGDLDENSAIAWSGAVWKSGTEIVTLGDADVACVDIGANDVTVTMDAAAKVATLQVVGSGTLTIAGTNALTVDFIDAETNVILSSAVVKTSGETQALPEMNIANGKEVECTFATKLDMPVITGGNRFIKKGETTAVLRTGVKVEPTLYIKEGTLELPSDAGYYSNDVYTDLPDIIIEGQSTLFLSTACAAIKDDQATVTLLNGGIFKFKNGNDFVGNRVVNCAFLIQNDGTTPAEFQGSTNGRGSTINGNITGYGQLKFTQGPGDNFYKINGVIADENKDEGKVLSLVFADPQEIQLAGANTYSGGTEIGAGTTLVVNGNTTALGAGSVTGACNIRLDSSLYLAGDIKSSGTITFNGGHSLYGTGEINGPSIVMHANGVLGHKKNGKVTVTVAKDKSLTGGGTVNADVTYAEGAILDVRGDTPNYKGAVTFGGAITLKVSEAKIGTEILTKAGLTAPRATIYVGDNTTSDNTLILKATDTGLAVVKAAAMVGNTPFETLTAALASDVEGTVQLVEALTISEATTLNLNGKTVSGTLVVNADTHISGNGKLTGTVSGSGSLIVDENVTLVVENSDNPFVDGYVVKVEGILQLTGGGYGFFTIEGNGTTEIPDEASFTIGVDGSKSDGVRGNIKTHLDVAGTLSVRFFNGDILTYEITPKSVGVSGQIQKDATYGTQSTILVPALTGTGTIGLDVAFADGATLDASEVTAEKCLTITGAVTLPETETVSVTLPAQYAVGAVLLKAEDLNATKFTATALPDTLKLEATAEALTIADAKTYVAEVNGTKYETLAEAVAQGGTVTVLADCSGEGIIISNAVTIDFDGHTYTVNNSTLAGSTGTKTICFQILKEAGDVTLKNGTIVGDYYVEDEVEGNKSIKMLVQNYANLTLEGMTLDATQGTNKIDATNPYVLSNNAGNTVIKGNTTIKAKEGGIAFDVCRYASYPSVSVTVESGKIIGKIEVSGTIGEGQSAALTLNGGDYTAATLDVQNTATVTKGADVTITAPDGYKWDNNTLVKAAIGNGATSGEIETVEDIATAIKTGNAITFADSVEVVKGDDGKVTVTVGGESTTLNLPAYYDATVTEGKTLSVTLNNNAKPVIAATEDNEGTSDDESIPALEVTAEGLKINLPKLETALTYELWGATSLEKDAEGKVSWTQVDFVEGQASHTFTGGTTYKFFKIVVTD